MSQILKKDTKPFGNDFGTPIPGKGKRNTTLEETSNPALRDNVKFHICIVQYSTHIDVTMSLFLQRYNRTTSHLQI